MNHISAVDKENQHSETEEMDTREDENVQYPTEKTEANIYNGDVRDGTPSTQEETMEEEDEVRSEATFRFVVPSFSRLREQLLSPPTFVRNLPWKIMVMPRTNQGQDRQPTKSVGFFLQCNGESESS
ncbi:ubiquitin carboxyl-terminal hydrolase 7-like [Limulus polyphemus]|uniref:Ubiquitin carboxyl-terminal hydrolase 7-like n=1 Tax=Limulus polyphemus TaxID=6850 RepID=A0ABM1BWX3_LIMPO|nr:ubiquitin carboxyl-terminal hydrolase 7-like [Limulus polyphemus]